MSCIIAYKHCFFCVLLEPQYAGGFDGIDGLIDSSDSVCRISSSAKCWRILSDCGEFHFDVGIVRAQSQRLHIGPNDITNPADFGVAVDFVDAGLFLVKTIL